MVFINALRVYMDSKSEEWPVVCVFHHHCKSIREKDQQKESYERNWGKALWMNSNLWGEHCYNTWSDKGTREGSFQNERFLHVTDLHFILSLISPLFHSERHTVLRHPTIVPSITGHITRHVLLLLFSLFCNISCFDCLLSALLQ